MKVTQRSCEAPRVSEGLLILFAVYIPVERPDTPNKTYGRIIMYSMLEQKVMYQRQIPGQNLSTGGKKLGSKVG